MRRTYTVPVKIGGISKSHKITFNNRKEDIVSGRPSSFIQWRRAELEKMRVKLKE